MTGVVHCLERRADSICDEHSLKPELQPLQRTFEANGYPSRLVRRTLNRTTTSILGETDQDKGEDEEKSKLLVLPYHIEPICKPLGVRVVFKSRGTLRQMLTRVKIARPAMKKKDVIYKVPCMDCDT